MQPNRNVRQRRTFWISKIKRAISGLATLSRRSSWTIPTTRCDQIVPSESWRRSLLDALKYFVAPLYLISPDHLYPIRE